MTESASRAGGVGPSLGGQPSEAVLPSEADTSAAAIDPDNVNTAPVQPKPYLKRKTVAIKQDKSKEYKV